MVLRRAGPPGLIALAGHRAQPLRAVLFLILSSCAPPVLAEVGDGTSAFPASGRGGPARRIRPECKFCLTSSQNSSGSKSSPRLSPKISPRSLPSTAQRFSNSALSRSAGQQTTPFGGVVEHLAGYLAPDPGVVAALHLDKLVAAEKKMAALTPRRPCFGITSSPCQSTVHVGAHSPSGRPASRGSKRGAPG